MSILVPLVLTAFASAQEKGYRHKDTTGLQLQTTRTEAIAL